MLIVGIYGACRREELLKLSLEDIQDLGDSVKITIPNTKTKIVRQFVIAQGNSADVDMLQLFRTYAVKRPADTKHSRFFIGYRNGLCGKQAIGINTIGTMPKVIAEYLKLPSPQEYTGHCFRRSSASILADTGVDISVLKRHGGWKSSTVAEGYVENSLQQKKEIAEKMFGGFGGNPLTKTTVSNPLEIDHPSTSETSRNRELNFAVLPPEVEPPPSIVPPFAVPPSAVPPSVVPPTAFNVPSTASTPNAVQLNNLTN